MTAIPGLVGHVKIQIQHHLIGQQLLNDVTSWMIESGWKEVVHVSLETEAVESFVEFIPGEFQSNGLKKIGLYDQAKLSDFQNDLYKWLWEIEKPAN